MMKVFIDGLPIGGIEKVVLPVPVSNSGMEFDSTEIDLTLKWPHPVDVLNALIRSISIPKQVRCVRRLYRFYQLKGYEKKKAAS